jgi:hypothetical protein
LKSQIKSLKQWVEQCMVANKLHVPSAADIYPLPPCITNAPNVQLDAITMGIASVARATAVSQLNAEPLNVTAILPDHLAPKNISVEQGVGQAFAFQKLEED